jgi:hypothetical protein
MCGKSAMSAMDKGPLMYSRSMSSASSVS